MKSNLARTITQRFDRAAGSYDTAATVQAEIAVRLVQKAAHNISPPATILDIGCGTGFAAAAAGRHWPQASITAIDGSPAMLRQAQQKIPNLRVIESDVAGRQFNAQFDLILSSMVLHWLPQPRALLENWRRWLRPNGYLLVATLIEGSFQEWRNLCAQEKQTDGLWLFPPADFAGDLPTEQQSISVAYPSAKDFLDRLKATGAASPYPGHKPLNAAAMRSLLAAAPKPFQVTYRVLYIGRQSLGNI